MNFNLVSPKGQGSTFTTRFQEEIEIPANAKVALNFAKLTKDSRILLNEENTVDIEFIEPIPFRDTAGAEAYPQATTTDRRITIPKGIYSVKDIQQRITDGLQTTLNIGDADVGTLTHNLNGMYNANVLSNSSTLKNKLSLNTGAELGLTLQKNKFWDESVITTIDNNQQNRLEVRDWRHGADAHQNDLIGGKNGTYRKTTGGSGNLDYDNYGLDDLKLYHYGTNMKAWENYREGISTGVANTRATTGKNNLDTDRQMNNYPFIAFKTDKTLEEIREDNTANKRGGNFVGLLSKNYMVGTPVAPDINTNGYVASAGRFSGNNPPQTDDAGEDGGYKVPICYLGVEVGQNTDGGDNDCWVNIYVGKNTSTVDSETAFPHNGAPITSMSLSTSIAIEDEDLGEDERVYIIIFPYFKADPRKARTTEQTDTTGGFIDRTTLHYQVVLRSEEKGDTILHDTLDDDTTIGELNGNIMDGFETVFARADPPVVLTENQIDAQIPFNIIVASKDDPAELSAGLVDIKFTALPEKTANQNLFPTIIDGLRFKISPELGGIISNTANNLNNTSITTNYIYPSLACEAQGFFQLQAIDTLLGSSVGSIWASLLKYGDLYSSGKTKSYSVYIENLPLRNYKNRITEVEGGQKGGIKKNILKSIPLPFSQNTVRYGLDRIAYYEPNNKEVSILKNQEFKTNSFNIEIRDMETDKIATDIKSAVFNFTITP
tara:strand:- start:2571 stop:4724 length:2154 start_codon:yes stop_codon:yes gene_type:complete